jgi:hypothetical protein
MSSRSGHRSHSLVLDLNCNGSVNDRIVTTINQVPQVPNPILEREFRESKLEWAPERGLKSHSTKEYDPRIGMSTRDFIFWFVWSIHYFIINKNTVYSKLIDYESILVFSELEQMKEKFSKLLLCEDMSGSGRKGVSPALTLSNAITNLSGSIIR